MNDIKPSKTTIGMDVARNRIRINRSTLRAIGNPPFVQLLVNPESRVVAIRAADKDEAREQTYRIPRSIANTDNPAVITSQSFMALLKEAFPSLSPENSYQLSGIIVPSERITLFSFDTMRIVQREIENDERNDDTRIENR